MFSVQHMHSEQFSAICDDALLKLLMKCLPMTHVYLDSN